MKSFSLKKMLFVLISDGVYQIKQAGVLKQFYNCNTLRLITNSPPIFNEFYHRSLYLYVL